MKTLFCLLAALILTSAAAEPKRPLGVPADAKPFNGRWYKVVLEKKSWHAARDKCKEMGGQLVTVPDAPTWAFVKTLTPAFAWLGATDEVTEGIWLCVDGTAVSHVVWDKGQPDNGLGAEHYMLLVKQAVIDAPKKDRPAAFICEWK